MKKNISCILLFAGSIFVLWSCTEKLKLVAPTSSPNGYAFVKFAQFSPNFRQVTNNGRDSINVYVNGFKINGAFMTYGSIFPTANNLYASVPAGAPQTIRITINGVTTPDSVTLATYTKTLVAGSYYSFIFTDSLLTSNDSKQMFVQDNFVISDTTRYTMRIVHAILNDTLGKNIDIYSTRQAANMFTNVSPGTVSAFTSQLYYFIADTLIVRRAGSTFELARLSTASIPLNRQRAYTLLYKGVPNAPSSVTVPKGRSLITFANQ